MLRKFKISDRRHVLPRGDGGDRRPRGDPCRCRGARCSRSRGCPRSRGTRSGTRRRARPVAPAPAPAPAGAHVQTAPMPGKIVDIKVNVGDPVKVNQPVLILEAMKMESEIVAEQDGVIASINVAKGDMVNPGDALFSLS